MEALVRWKHPSRGLIPPAQFIPVAEESTLIKPLTRFVLESALGQMATWRERGQPMRLGLNVSPRHLLDSEFVHDITRQLDAFGVAPGDLEIELTETALITETQRTADTLNALRALGVRVAIDDFGTGHTSLANLRRLPIDVLKLDRSLVHDLDRDPAARALLSAITRLCDTLGFEVVAEGIETPEQLEIVRSYGCTVGQGYLLATPAAAGGVQTHRSPLIEDVTPHHSGLLLPGALAGAPPTRSSGLVLPGERRDRAAAHGAPSDAPPSPIITPGR